MRFREARLVRAVGRGERDAFAGIYREYKDSVYTLACHLSGDHAMAEDVVHDVFLALARRAPELRMNGRLRTYLARSCVHRIHDLRDRRCPDAVPGSTLDGLADPRPAFAIDPLDHAVHQEEAGRVAEALALLPAAQREVVVLRVFSGLRYREIAEVSGVSLHTARSRFRLAAAALRERLERKRGQDDPPS
jgi:RNA polymerase sigma-70 factor, ECF subfamily